MRTIGLIAVTAALAGVSTGTEAAEPRLPYHPMVPTVPNVPTVVTTQQAGPAMPGRQMNRRQWQQGNGQWAGSRPPAYRRPTRGWIVPNYWLSPGFGVGNYGDYGLTPPPSGYGWTRYYDDAVLVDREGRVYDWAEDVDWEGTRGGYPGYEGGPGPGPVPGAAVPGAPVYSYDYDGVTVGGHSYHETWTGSWTGSYDGAPPERYDGQFDGGYNGTIPGADYAPPPRGHRRHGGEYYAGSGAFAGSGGWYYPAPTVTTIVLQSQPVVTTTSYVEEYAVARPVMRAKPKMIRKPRPKPRCSCR